jgi:hypothetical protein
VESETNGPVNWAMTLYERIGEFGALPLGAEEGRVHSLSQRFGDGVEQRVGLSFALAHNPLVPKDYRKAPAAFAPGLSVNWIGGEVRRFQSSSPGRTRTYDKAVNSRLLYQLSYRGSVLANLFHAAGSGNACVGGKGERNGSEGWKGWGGNGCNALSGGDSAERLNRPRRCSNALHLPHHPPDPNPRPRTPVPRSVIPLPGGCAVSP